LLGAAGKNRKRLYKRGGGGNGLFRQPGGGRGLGGVVVNLEKIRKGGKKEKKTLRVWGKRAQPEPQGKGAFGQAYAGDGLTGGLIGRTSRRKCGPGSGRP